MAFEFATAGRIIFGAGSIGRVADIARTLGQHVLMVTGADHSRAEAVLDHLDAADIRHHEFQVVSEPDTQQIREGAALARDKGCDLVIGMGGGSVMDAAKALAALITNDQPLNDYLEVIGKGQPLTRPPAPSIAIPTTAGTGSEVTRNAVIRSRNHGVKVSMRHWSMLPDVAIVDPELTLSLPPAITAATGFDALCQLLEGFVSKKANPITDSLCREGLARCGRSLQTVYTDGGNMVARTDMALASLFSGLALANGGLGAVHGIAGPLGGLHDAPHGAVCARLLPAVTATNISMLQRSDPQSPSLARYVEIARILTGEAGATALDGLQWLQTMADRMQIPPLNAWGLKPSEVPALAAQALRSSSMQGNPVALSVTIAEEIIHSAMETLS